MEDQFGLQRRKFMNLMVEKDEELSQVKRSVEQLSSELQRCQQQLRDREEEVNSVYSERLSCSSVLLSYEEQLQKPESQQ